MKTMGFARALPILGIVVNFEIMIAAKQKPMTLAEFLEWEQRQELRYEFDGFQPIAMTGGTFAHAAIQCNLAISVGGRLRGKRCVFIGNDLKIDVVGRIRYPDGFVVCTPVSTQAKIARIRS
jgi:Uma2 family endonuclease